MKRVLGTAVVVVLLGSLSGCGDSHDSILNQQVQTAKEIADTLSSIKDKASADTAKPKLKVLGDRWRDLKKRADALP